MKNDLFSCRSVSRSALFLLSATLFPTLNQRHPIGRRPMRRRLRMPCGPDRALSRKTQLFSTGRRPRAANIASCVRDTTGGRAWVSRLVTRRTGLLDPTLIWMKDSLAGREPQIDRIGISYMYAGAWDGEQIGRKWRLNAWRVSRWCAHHDRVPPSEPGGAARIDS
jgi:hypothetical protein